ncbi:hypothetical protein C0584_05405 [Candidatus Parcubacteria bacterium]|nr:MAG: hypothetical protein C0584_05405 [Candidatus Parcubacteria bacterium]
MTLKEIEIIKSCQKGDLERFGELYDDYIDKIYNFIYYKTSHRETAEDLTSKTFFKAVKNIQSFGKKEKYFAAWLFQIARNTVIDHYRSSKKTANIEDFWDIDSGEDLLVDLENKEKILLVKKYLAEIKSEKRDIVIMRIWQGMSYREISEILGKNEGSVKVMFSRTIKEMKKNLPIEVILLILIF